MRASNSGVEGRMLVVGVLMVFYQFKRDGISHYGETLLCLFVGKNCHSVSRWETWKNVLMYIYAYLLV
jgi:hypothetical protein